MRKYPSYNKLSCNRTFRLIYNEYKTGVRGSRSKKAKIKEKDVLKIRKLRNEGKSYKELMEIFPLKETQLRRIIKFKAWV